MDYANSLFDFIRRSPTAFHAVAEMKRLLLADGYTELSPGAPVVGAGKYFVTKNASSLIAFRSSGKPERGFLIAASHSDSPTFRVKLDPALGGRYTRLAVERYGGMIYYTWMDRPLSVAGRVFVRTADGAIEQRLAHIDRDLLTIPSVAIHMHRSVNENCALNPAVDLLPLFGAENTAAAFNRLLAESVGLAEGEEIVSHDLFLTVREEGRVFGGNGEFILSPRLDDLECVYTSFEGFRSASETDCTPVLAVFDNEEVGSATKQGAASTFLADTLLAIAGSRENYEKMLAQSFMISADNAHAVHPNHPEYADASNAPVINGGVVLKYNASQRYATDGFSDALLREICRKASVRLQNYYNRADLPGGGTLGSIADTKVSIPTVDIGLAQLAMHAAVETAGAADIEDALRLFTAFFSSDITVRGDRAVVR